MLAGILNLVNSNAPAVNSVLENLGYSPYLTHSSQEMNSFSHLIIPGVGSFAAVVDEITHIPNLTQAVLSFAESGKPILGICLGMQLLGLGSEESIEKQGLGLLDYTAVEMTHLNGLLPTPHVGWNQVEVKRRTRFSMEFPLEQISISRILSRLVSRNSNCAKLNMAGVLFHAQEGEISTEFNFTLSEVKSTDTNFSKIF